MAKHARKSPPKPAPEQATAEQTPVILEQVTEQKSEKAAPRTRADSYADPAEFPVGCRVVFNEATYNAKPKRAKSAERMALYDRSPEGMSLEQHTAAYKDFRYSSGSQIGKGYKSLATADRRWDLKRGFISVVFVAPEQPEPAVTE
jgi:hypothetical protein